MANTVLSLFAALAIFIILTEKLTINLIFGEDYIIEFHFIVFALVIKNSASSEKRRKKDDNERKSRFQLSRQMADSLYHYVGDGNVHYRGNANNYEVHFRFLYRYAARHVDNEHYCSRRGNGDYDV